MSKTIAESELDLNKVFDEFFEKYKDSKSVEVYEEQLEWWFKIIDELRDENKRLKATLDAYAKQVSRLEQRLLKYEKVHDGKFIEKDITTSESKPLFD